MEGRVCPDCKRVWLSSSWRGPMRVRCDCGTALNLAEAQFDRELIDECKAIAADRRGLTP